MTIIANTIQRLDTVMSEFSKLSLPQAIEHLYVETSLGLHFPGSNKAEVIARFKANCMVMVNDDTVKENLKGSDTFTIINSLINATRKGLSINPFDKECCIVKFGTTATLMEMVAGKKKLLVKSGAIINIDYLECIYNSDYINQKGLIFEHKRNFRRPKDDKKIGVLMIVTLPDGRKKYKYVDKSDIDKRRNVIIEKTKRACAKWNNTPEETKKKIEAASGMWNTWEDEMWQKTAVNIFSKDIPNISPVLRNDIEFDGEEDEEVETQDVFHSDVTDDVQEAQYVNDPILLANAKDILTKPNIGLNGPQIVKIQQEIDQYDDERLQALLDHCSANIKKNEQQSENPLDVNIGNNNSEPVI